MTVPLSASSYISPDGRQRVKVWHLGGSVEHASPPLLPYCFAKRPASSLSTKVTKAPLSTLEPEEWFLSRFPNEAKRGAFAKRMREGGVKVAEANVRMVERLVIDEPDYFRKLARGTRPKVLYVDIEQLTDGSTFPPVEAPIIAVAWAVDDGPIFCEVNRNGGAERAFIEAFRLANPDIVVGYHHTGYDLPVVAHHLGDDARHLSRDGSLPAVSVDREGQRTFEVEGRIIYDAHPPTEMDQELKGVEDYKLKTIAKFLGLPAVEAPDYNTAALSEEQLREYNVSDVHLLRQVAARYLPDRIALAESVGAPLENVLNGGSAYAAGILAARVNREAGIISDGTNASRYAGHIPNDPKTGKPLGYEGATVAIHSKGTFAPIWKSDYASLYPSIAVALGIGPDNTRLLHSWASEPTGEPLRLIRTDGDLRYYELEDAALGKVFQFEVRGRSRFADLLGDMMRDRLVLKENAKKEQNAEAARELVARAGMMKIVVNSAYGYMGADFAPHGSKAVAMLIAAGGRAMVRLLEDRLPVTIETDTDGVFHGLPAAKADLEAYINGSVGSLYAMRPIFRVDVDEYEAAYFYKAKSYLLLDGGKMTAHGYAFKGSSHPNLFRRVVKEVGMAILTGQDVAQAARAARDLSRYAPEDFVKRARLTKDAAGYSSQKALAVHVAADFERVHGKPPAIGERMRYVKTTKGYEVATPEAFTRLDSAYYEQVVDAALERLGALEAARGRTPFAEI